MDTASSKSFSWWSAAENAADTASEDDPPEGDRNQIMQGSCNGAGMGVAPSSLNHLVNEKKRSV